MTYNIIKILISAILIALISEISKRSTFFGAVLASIPLVSVLAMIWLYIDTNDSLQVVQLSKGIFWLVIPSLVLFITFPFFIRLQFSFYTALSAALLAMVVTYFITITVLEKFDIHL